MKLSTRAFLTVVFFWLAAQWMPLVHAFSLNDTGHGGITRDALTSISITISSETLKFTNRAKEEIKDANFEVDHHQLAASFHFDDESLNAGTARIMR